MKVVSKIFIFMLVLILVLGTIGIIGFSRFKKENLYLSTYNGFLKVSNGKLKNQFNEDFQLRGLSSHGIQWESYDCITYDSLKHLKENWNMNVFRVAMYTEEDGYISNPEKIYDRVIKIVDICIELKIYVVVDWHILSDGNPNIHLEESKDFFEKLSKRYKNNPNLIYEICNEPNNVQWEADIFPYANNIIPIIRKNSPNAIVIVGTPGWSRDILSIDKKRLEYDNILYSYHFYADTHRELERERIRKAIKMKIPIIVSEFGTCDYTGNGKINIEETDKWLKLLNENNISWINWSFSYNREASAILKEKFKARGNGIEASLTESGKYIKGKMRDIMGDVSK